MLREERAELFDKILTLQSAYSSFYYHALIQEISSRERARSTSSTSNYRHQVDADKFPNNPYKSVLFTIDARCYSTGSFGFIHCPRVKPRIYRVRNPWRRFTRQIYCEVGGTSSEPRPIEKSDPEFARQHFYRADRGTLTASSPDTFASWPCSRL